MWCAEHDLSDDLRRPLLAYRRRRLALAIVGLLTVGVALMVMIEQSWQYMISNTAGDSALAYIGIALLAASSGSLQAYRYWLWRRSL